MKITDRSCRTLDAPRTAWDCQVIKSLRQRFRKYEHNLDQFVLGFSPPAEVEVFATCDLVQQISNRRKALPGKNIFEDAHVYGKE